MLSAKNINKSEFSQPTKKIKQPKSFTRSKLFRKISHKVDDSLTMCANTKEVLRFLMNRSDDYIVRPGFLQKRFKFGNHTWRKITRELRAEGFFVLKTGKVYGGSVWDLVMPTALRTVDSSSISVPYKNLERSIREYYTINTSTKDHINNKTTTKTTVTTENSAMKILDENVVVFDLMNKMIEKVGLTEKLAEQLLNMHGANKISEKLSLLEIAMSKPNNVRVPPAWFRASLRDEYPSYNPKQEAIVSSIDDSEQIKHVHKSFLKESDIKIGGYMAKRTEDDRKIHDKYWERFKNNKRSARSASI